MGRPIGDVAHYYLIDLLGNIDIPALLELVREDVLVLGFVGIRLDKPLARAIWPDYQRIFLELLLDQLRVIEISDALVSEVLLLNLLFPVYFLIYSALTLICSRCFISISRVISLFPSRNFAWS